MTTHDKKNLAALRVATRRLDRGQRTRRLRRNVHVLGGLMLVIYLGMSALSYLQAPALWLDSDYPNARAYFQAMADQLQPLLPTANAWLTQNGFFGGAGATLLSVWALHAAATVIVLALILALLRGGERADPGLPRLLLFWSAAFAFACAPAFPVFTQDFWLSAVWGRMVANGVNPYHTLFGPGALAGLPLDHFPMAMSYGPLWAVVSAVIMSVAGTSQLAMTILFKALLVAAWLGALYLVYRITEGKGLRERCLAVLIVGWTPAGVSQTVAEGHNDILMVALALLWMLLLLRGRGQAPVALVLATLCKYVTAPLLAIDLIHSLRVQRIGWWPAFARVTATGILLVGGIALFYRSPAFFDGVRLVGSWHFLQPGEAVLAIELLLGISFKPFMLAADAAFPVVALYLLWKAWSSPSSERTLQAAIGVMAAVLFTAVSHLWAWYAIWGLALAALLPSWWLSRFIIGVSIFAPFTLAAWWVEPFQHHQEVAALLMYIGAAMWMVVTGPMPLVLVRTTRATQAFATSLMARPIGRPAVLGMQRTGTHG